MNKLTPEAIEIIEKCYKEWCKKTKRNGGVLIGASIHELISVIYQFFIDNHTLLKAQGLYTEAEMNAARGLAWDACYEYVNWIDIETTEPPDKETFLSSLPSQNISEWVRVSERLPDVGIRVLCITESGHMEVGYILNQMFQRGSTHTTQSFEAGGYKVTHWRNLPSPPTN